MESLEQIQYFSLRMLNLFLQENRNNKKVAAELTNLIFNKEPKISMRASWVLLHLSFERPTEITPQLPKLIKFLQSENKHTGACRNVLRIFHEIEIPEQHCGILFDICLAFTIHAHYPHAVRVFALYTAALIVKKFPELSNELQLVVNELKTHPQPPSINAAFKKLDKMLLKYTKV